MVASFAMKISDGCNSREVHHVLRVKSSMILLPAILIIILLAFFAWLAWTFIPVVWAKYLVGGTLLILAIYKFVILALSIT